MCKPAPGPRCKGADKRNNSGAVTAAKRAKKKKKEAAAAAATSGPTAEELAARFDPAARDLEFERELVKNPNTPADVLVTIAGYRADRVISRSSSDASRERKTDLAEAAISHPNMPSEELDKLYRADYSYQASVLKAVNCSEERLKVVDNNGKFLTRSQADAISDRADYTPERFPGTAAYLKAKADKDAAEKAEEERKAAYVAPEPVSTWDGSKAEDARYSLEALGGRPWPREDAEGTMPTRVYVKVESLIKATGGSGLTIKSYDGSEERVSGNTLRRSPEQVYFDLEQGTWHGANQSSPNETLMSLLNWKLVQLTGRGYGNS